MDEFLRRLEPFGYAGAVIVAQGRPSDSVQRVWACRSREQDPGHAGNRLHNRVDHKAVYGCGHREVGDGGGN